MPKPQKPPRDYEADTIARLVGMEWLRRYDDAGQLVAAGDPLVSTRRCALPERKWAAGATWIERIRWNYTSQLIPRQWRKGMAQRREECSEEVTRLQAEGARFLAFVVAPASARAPAEYLPRSAAEIEGQLDACASARSRLNGQRRGKKVRRYLPKGVELVLGSDHVAVTATGDARPHTHLLFADFSRDPGVLERVEAALDRLGLSVLRSDGAGPMILRRDVVKDHVVYLHNYPISFYRSTGEKVEVGEAVWSGEVDALALIPALFGLIGDGGRMRQCVRYYGSFSDRSSSAASSTLSKEGSSDCVSLPPGAVEVPGPEPVPESDGGGELVPFPAPEGEEDWGRGPRTRILHEKEKDHPTIKGLKITTVVIQWTESLSPTREAIEAKWPRLGEKWRRERAALAAARLAEMEKAAAEVAVWMPTHAKAA